MAKTNKNRTGSFSRTPTQGGGRFQMPDNSVGVNQLTNEVANALVPTGVSFPMLGTLAPSGYVMLDGLTIGNRASAATAINGASTAMKNLYLHLWNNLANTEAPVSGGRGASALADFNANKTLTLADLRGRLPVGRDPTSLRITGATVLGASGGSESVSTSTAQTSISIAQLPLHNHTFTSSSNAFQTNDQGGINNIQPTGLPNARQTAQTGSGTGHSHTYTNSVVQPYSLFNWIIKV